MSDITIPPEALEAGKDSAFSWLRSYMEDDVRVQHMTDEELTELVSAACLAMLRTWPGMQHMDWNSRMADFSSHIILPLPQKETSE